jgi:hypothetical protein
MGNWQYAVGDLTTTLIDRLITHHSLLITRLSLQKFMQWNQEDLRKV